MKTNKKILCLLLSVMLMLIISATTVFAGNSSTMTVTLRIEGINSNMFYDTVEIPYTDSLTLKSALTYIDSQEESITIAGIESEYITDINGDTAGSFNGWDGWLFMINGVESAESIGDCILNDNDSILLYYGDPYGVGMQFPVAYTSKIADGIIKFTSSDTTYDTNYNPTITVNPVVGATVIWGYGNTKATYTTDEKGEIKINSAQLTEGEHTLQISRATAAGLPTALRFAPDFSVSVTATSSQSSSVSSQTATSSSPTSSQALGVNSQAATSSKSATTSTPKTGDNNNILIYVVLMSLSIITVFIFKGRKQTYEK